MLRTPFLVARVSAALALVLLATYYLLASVPFAYYHFLQFAHFWWQPTFMRLHPLLLVGPLVLWRSTGTPRSRRATRCLDAAGGAVLVCMAAAAWAPALVSYETAAALAFAPLLLLAAASAVDIAGTLPDAGPVPGPRMLAAIPLVAPAMVTAVVVTATYTLASAARGMASALGAGELGVAVLVSLALHVALFAFVPMIASLARRVFLRGGAAGRSDAWAIAACAWLALSLLIRRSILSALVLDDARAVAFSLVLALALVLFWIALMVTRRAPDVDVLRAMLVPGTSAMGASAVAVAVLVVCVAVVPPLLVVADWGGTLQKLLVMAAWIASAVFVAHVPARRRSLVCGIAIASTVAAVAGATAGASVHASGVGDADPSRLDVGLAVERYATFDSSLSVVLDVVRSALTDTTFNDAVRVAADVTDDRSLAAVPLRLVDGAARASHRPHIFIVVVDSLRPDYLSPYAPAVTFTPAIEAFARESIVIRHAFTPYAGTALSEPGLWAGGLIPRAMYLQPFSVMNNLERLVDANGYRPYVSVDEILRVVLSDWPGMVRLDGRFAEPGRRDQMYKFDLCSTVQELTGRLDHDPAAPVFFYSQPQNLHIRVLAGDEQPRTNSVTIGGVEFFRPAVIGLERVDSCFGNLVAYLKRRGLYDDSIVVLTSDHGDAYGEAGRWAHAFYVAPEIMRIPLIIHVPAALAAGRAPRTNAVTLLTDLTPTLYDLLGAAPAHAELLGRSFLPRAGARAPRPGPRLIQSSYSRVFGLLDESGRWLYVADSNHGREEFYDLNDASPFPRSFPNADRVQYRKWLLERIGYLNAFYAPHR